MESKDSTRELHTIRESLFLFHSNIFQSFLNELFNGSIENSSTGILNSKWNFPLKSHPLPIKNCLFSSPEKERRIISDVSC